ncbi:uroporphyrinogen decarboxylase family protein [Ihubacter sp. mB4P-1]|uniref:uroporphyrinogen decarboxylase family protein n=1 Tax=Ihubacter sp. mB4P-1 TaxID=3242370 RepID=UPI001379C80D
MAKLIDYKCRYAAYNGLSKEDAESKGLRLPDALCSAEQIAKLAGNHAVLPFDPVLEAENLGAQIKLDDSSLGPRKDRDVITSLDQLADLPRLDVTKGRLAETVKAIALINSNGGNATMELHGPVTILNGLADIMMVLMGWRKNADIMAAFFNHTAEDLAELAMAVYQAGARIIYYTDSPGSLDILGPKYARQITEDFTVPFLRLAGSKLPSDCVFHLCPKTSFLLAGCQKAQWKKLALNEPTSYDAACLAACGKVRILGQRCRKDTALTVNCINYLDLI